MPKIRFHEYAQKIRPRTTRKDTQEKFMTQLLFYSGVEGNKIVNSEGDELIELEDKYDDGYLRKVYAGSRVFSQGLKDSILNPLPRESLIGFFSDYIGNANIKSTMLRFDIPEITPKHDSLFYDALCTQLEYIIEVMEDDSEDIVASEYIRLLQESDPQGLKNATGYLLSDLGNLGEIITKILDLAKLLEDFNYEQSDSPIYDLFESIKGISVGIPIVELTHTEASHAVKGFHNQHESLMQFLSGIVSAQGYNGYGTGGVARVRRKDVVYTMNAVQSNLKSFYSSMSDVFSAENIMKEELMLFKAHMSLGRNELYREIPQYD